MAERDHRIYSPLLFRILSLLLGPRVVFELDLCGPDIQRAIPGTQQAGRDFIV
jgi:hypothetical protein